MFTKNLFLVLFACFTLSFSVNAQERVYLPSNTEETEQVEAPVAFSQTPADDIKEVVEDVKEIISDLPKEVDTTEQLVTWETFLYSIIMLVIGYLSKWIPILNNVKDTWQRVAAGAVALVLALTLYRGELPLIDIIQYVVSFVLSTRLVYPALLKPLAPTPKVARKAVSENAAIAAV